MYLDEVLKAILLNVPVFRFVSVCRLMKSYSPDDSELSGLEKQHYKHRDIS
jgi:hypothetical protein